MKLAERGRLMSRWLLSLAGAGAAIGLLWIANDLHFAWAKRVLHEACTTRGGARVNIPIVQPGSIKERSLSTLPTLDGCASGHCLQYLIDPRFSSFIARDRAGNDYSHPNTGVLPNNAFPLAGIIGRASQPARPTKVSPDIERIGWYRFRLLAAVDGACPGDVIRMPDDILPGGTYTYRFVCRAAISGVPTSDFVVVPFDTFAVIRSPSNHRRTHPLLPEQSTWGWTIRRGRDDAIMVSAARMGFVGSMARTWWRHAADALLPFAEPARTITAGCGPRGIGPTHLPGYDLVGVGLDERNGAATATVGVSINHYD